MTKADIRKLLADCVWHQVSSVKSSGLVEDYPWRCPGMPAQCALTAKAKPLKDHELKRGPMLTLVMSSRCRNMRTPLDIVLLSCSHTGKGV